MSCRAIQRRECRFGGGDKIATITLGFESTIDALQAQNEAAPYERSSYLLPSEMPFTLTFEPEFTPVPMTYADHIFPQHEPYISEDPDDFCRQVLTDGYLAPAD